MVPPRAISNLPNFLRTAPVKEPFSCPNISLSNKVSGIAEQLMARNGPLDLKLKSCIALATSSFPVPDGPVMKTLASVGEHIST
jgi:hypothetical protein